MTIVISEFILGIIAAHGFWLAVVIIMAIWDAVKGKKGKGNLNGNS